MSFNGSGLFVVNSTGQPVSANTLIESSVFNALTADLGTGLSTAITKDGQTTITANLPMAGYRHTGVGNASARTMYSAAAQIQDGSLCYGTVGGTADVITLTLTPAITAYAAGQKFSFLSSGANTTNVTINVSTVGAKAITKNGTTALAAGDIPSGAICVIEYDGTQFQLINVKAASLGANTFTGLQTFAAGADIASATTVDLDAATGNLVRITGTTATTGVTLTRGPVFCYPTGAWPLTYHATNMPIKGGVSYTCAAGDTVIFSKDGNGTLHVDIFKADGTALAAGPSIQHQTFTRFTTGGSSTAYTLTPTPATTANTTGQRFRVAFHTAAGATPTLAVSGQTAANLKYKDSTGAKQAVTSTQIPSSWSADVEYDGTDWVVMQVPSSTGGATLGTPVATTSGTSVDITGIPENAKIIYVTLNGVSTNGTSALLLQLGDSGGPETTGYNGVSSAFNGTGHALNADGFRLHGIPAAAGAYDGLLTLVKQDGSDNTWVASWFTNNRNSAYEYKGVGQKSLSATLDRVRITTVGGSDTFDAGELNITVVEGS